MTHRNVCYTIGLNVYEKPLKDLSHKDGGFYLCKKKDIGYWLRLYHDPIICEAVLCDESVVFKGGRKIKTDRFILQNPLPVRVFMSQQNEETLIDYVYDDGLALEYIDEQTPDICLLATRQNGRAIQFVKNPSPALWLEAVKQNGRALQHIPVQSQPLCMAAVKQTGYALRYVKKQDASLCMMAVHNNGLALKHVLCQTPYICKVACEQNGFALQFVRRQTPDIVAAALKANPLAKLYKGSLHVNHNPNLNEAILYLSDED
jgi:hypothetical protein